MRKDRKKLQLALLFLLICISLTACGGDASDFAADTEASNFSDHVSDTIPADFVQTQQPKLIRTVDIKVEVASDQQLKPAIDDMMMRTDQLGGYVTYNNINRYSDKASADLALKIPKDQVDFFLNDVSEIYKVISMEDCSEDVTSQYIDVESRLQVKEKAKEKYTAYLDAAENVTELLEIEDCLNHTIEDIESSKALLKSLDNQIDYTEVVISIKCADISYEPTYFERVKDELGDIFKECGNELIEGFGWLLQALIVCVYRFPILYILIKFLQFCFGGKFSFRGLLKKRKKKGKTEEVQKSEEIK